MLTSTVIGSQHWYYNEAFFSKLAQYTTEKYFFTENKIRYFNVNRVYVVTNDGLNILIKAVTC